MRFVVKYIKSFAFTFILLKSFDDNAVHKLKKKIRLVRDEKQLFLFEI